MPFNLFSSPTLYSVRKHVLPYRKLKCGFYDTLRLTCSGSVLFVPENLYCIDYAVKHLPTQDPVIEIGSFLGMSTNMLAYFLRKHQRANVLFTCDRWEFEEKEKQYYEQTLGISANLTKEFVKESFTRNLRFFSHARVPNTVELFSDEFFDKWSRNENTQDVFGAQAALGGPISFAYVDGNHTLEFLRRDFINIDRYLVKNGFIFFDDSAPHLQCDVPAFMKEVRKSGRYQLVMKNPNYLWKKIH